jgi:pimeloyl-ACP methyl ester carboxylesterase
VGNGPHLCFLHGFCEDSTIWDNAINHFSQTHTCITIDLPGFGKSKNLKFQSIPEFADAVFQILRHEKIENPIIFGHSLGGYIACEYASKHPQSISGIGLIHSTSMKDSEKKKENRKKAITFIKKYGTSEFFQLFIKKLVAENNQLLLGNKLINVIKNTPTKSVINGMNAMMDRSDHSHLLSQVDYPVLFILGDKDEHYSKNEILNQASKCKNAQVEIIENSGHLSMVENEKAFQSAVQKFLIFTKAMKKNRS